MPTFLIAVVIRIVVSAFGALRKRNEAKKPKPLCLDCSFAHVQHSACGRRAVSCTFGGGVRLIALDVLYCTDYRSRYVPPRPAVGFVRQIATAE